MATDLLQHPHVFLTKKKQFFLLNYHLYQAGQVQVLYLFLEKFHIVLGQKSIFFKLEIFTHKISSTIPLPCLKKAPSELTFANSLHFVLFIVCFQMATDLLEHFLKIFDTVSIFSKFILKSQNSQFPKFLNSKIIPAIPLLCFERKPFKQLFAQSRIGELFHIFFKMGTDLLENFEAKIDIFKVNFLNTIPLYM